MYYTVASLFAGVGGICLGFQNAHTNNSSYKIKWANEIDEYACETYRTNFNHTLFEGDIEKILHPEKIKDQDERNKYLSMNQQVLNEKIDVLNGGFPCQAFSIAGERKGFDDDRGNLFLKIVDLINQLGQTVGKPRVLVLENVKNLQSHDKGKTYQIIKSKLEDCGYTIFEKVLNTMKYTDLPQNRERIYIVGFLNEEDAKMFKLFDENHLKEIEIFKSKEDREKDIKNIIDYSLTREVAEKYYYTKKKYPKYFSSKEKDNASLINLDEQITEMYQFYQCRRGIYVRKNKSNVCPTLTANMGTGGHNVPLIKVYDGIRKMTPSETFKMQGFPVGSKYSLPKKFKGRDYPDSQLYKQAGNAVSVPMIEIISNYLLKILEVKDKKIEENLNGKN